MSKKYMLHANMTDFEAWLLAMNNQLEYPDEKGTTSYTTEETHPDVNDNRVACLVNELDISIPDRSNLLTETEIKALGWFPAPDIEISDEPQ